MTTQYKEGRFSEAFISCQQLLSAKPNDVYLRYWRANILINLNNLAGAKQDYLFILGSSSDVTLKGYCRTALESIATTSRAAQAQGNTPLKPSVERITRQADAYSNGILMDGQARQNYFYNKGEVEAAQAGNAQTIYAMRSAKIKVGNTWAPRYTEEEIQAEINRQADTAYHARLINSGRGTEALQVAQQKAFETQASAANLAAQINSASKTGFHLTEEGTNFYVRQYNAPPTNSSFTQNPATVTINDSADAQRGRFDSPMQATARALDPALQKRLDMESRNAIKSNVYGRINPPDQASKPH